MRKYTLKPNAAKNTNYIEKYFKQKLRRIKSPKVSYKLFTNHHKSPQICESQIVYRWWFASDLQTQNLAKLIRICSLSCRYLCELSKGTNFICRSSSHLYTLFSVTYVQFVNFYTVRKKLTGKYKENMT